MCVCSSCLHYLYFEIISMFLSSVLHSLPICNYVILFLVFPILFLFPLCIRESASLILQLLIRITHYISYYSHPCIFASHIHIHVYHHLHYMQKRLGMIPALTTAPMAPGENSNPPAAATIGASAAAAAAASTGGPTANPSGVPSSGVAKG